MFEHFEIKCGSNFFFCSIFVSIYDFKIFQRKLFFKLIFCTSSPDYGSLLQITESLPGNFPEDSPLFSD